VVSPDAGRTKESEQYAVELGLPLVHMPKTRDKQESSKIIRPESVTGIAGKKCITIDDMIDTGGTIMSAAETMKKSGAKSIIVCATHGMLSNNAAEKFARSDVDTLLLVNTIPQAKNLETLGSKLRVLSIEPLVAESIRRIESGESLTHLFNDRNYN
jgi:ribose-phosphate pyrophosphokinase